MVEVWISQQLKDRIRRLGVITAEPGQRAAQHEPPGADLEAEP